MTGYSQSVKLPAISFTADGTSDIVKQVRHLTRLGADVVKIYMESFEKKQTSDDSVTGAFNYSKQEYQTLVDEAHRAGLRVAAHTYSDSAARLAIDIGVNSIEHGLYLKEETFCRMAQKNIYYVPTLLVYEFWRDDKLARQVIGKRETKIIVHVQTVYRNVPTGAQDAGQDSFGTDTFEFPGTNAEELSVMVRSGMKPIDALRSATSVFAELLGLGHEIGTIEKGKPPTSLLFPAIPSGSRRPAQQVSFMMKNGKIYLHN